MISSFSAFPAFFPRPNQDILKIPIDFQYFQCISSTHFDYKNVFCFLTNKKDKSDAIELLPPVCAMQTNPNISFSFSFEPLCFVVC